MMKTEFQFRGFEPEDALMLDAEEVLEQVMSAAPFGAYVVAKLEKVEHIYFCEIDVYTKRGSTIASSTQENPYTALQHVEESLLKKLNKWKENKFFTGATALQMRRKAHLITN